MPPGGGNDYDVVIGVAINDDTEPGSKRVKNNFEKMTDDVRRNGERQAREYARVSRDIFGSTDRHITGSAQNMTRRLVQVFDSNNFLLRNLARQAGSTWAAVGIGVGKLALTYRRFGVDTEEASQRARRAISAIHDAVTRLGSDSEALPAAKKAVRDLAQAYVDMGRTSHAASIKAGNEIENSVYKRVTTLQKGLTATQLAMERLGERGVSSADRISKRVNETTASVSRLLGGAKVDAAFFKGFTKAATDVERIKFVLDKLGPSAAVAFGNNQTAIGKLVDRYLHLESTSKRSIKSQADGMASLVNKAKGLESELASVTGVLGGTGEAASGATAAVGGLSAGMIALGVTVGIIVVAIVALIALIAAFTIIAYKGASAAGEYGDQIYKLSLSTGLSTKSLSALTVIAKETGTELDSLAKTFTRMQIQIQRGVDQPFSEAGRAIRALHVNLQDLRKANPDQQVLMLAKAFNNLNNQNVRAAVAAQLFSRDAERQSKILLEIGERFEKAQQKAKKFGLELDEMGAVKAHKYTAAVADLSLAWQGLWVQLGIKILPALTILVEDLTDSTSGWGKVFQFTGDMIAQSLIDLEIRIESLSIAWEKLKAGQPGAALSEAFVPAEATKRVIQKMIERQKEIQEAADALRKRGLQGDDEMPNKFVDSLADRVRKLRLEIAALQKTSGEDFNLRFELEDLEKVKQGYEQIFKLRRDMGLDISQPLPQFRIWGTQDEQLQDLQGILAYIRGMERLRKIFDDVRKVANEQSDAQAQLAAVMQTATMPIVDALTRAEIKYFTGIRDRRNAEAELTADIIADARLRRDAIQDEVGSSVKAYLTLNKELGRAFDKRREQRLEDETFLRILNATPQQEADLQRQIADRSQLDKDRQPIPTELTTIAAHAASIDQNVAAIAVKVGAGGAVPAQTQASIQETEAERTRKARLEALGIPTDAVEMPKISQYRNGEFQGYDTAVAPSKKWPGAYIMGDGTVMYPDGRKPSALQNDDVSNYSGGFGRTESWVTDPNTGLKTRVGSREWENQGPPETEEVETVQASTVPQLRQRITQQYQEEAAGNRVSMTRAATEDILKLEAQLNTELIAYDTDFRRQFLATQVERRNSHRQTLISIDMSEADLNVLNDKNSERYKQVWDEADASRLAGHVSLKEEIIGLENAIAHNGEDAADQYREAYLRAIRDVQLADQDAVKSQIESSVKLADQSIFHAERMRAGIMEKVAGEGGITETMTDAFSSTMDTVADGISQLLGVVNQHLGFFSNLITSIETKLLRMVTDRLLMNLLNMLLGPMGGGTPGGVSGGTPPFAGFAGGGNGPLANVMGLSSLLTGGSGLPSPVGAGGTPGIFPGASGIPGLGGGGPAGAAAGLSGMLSGMLPALGIAAPLLGLSLGGNLGGPSRLGRGLGMAGGAIAGGFGLAAVAATGAFGLGGIGPGLAFLGAAPFLAPIAGALLIGSYIIGRNAQRRKDETFRNGVSTETGTAIWDLIHQAQSPRGLSVAEATQKWAEIDTNYHQQISQIKDKKTRRHAELQWTQDFMPLRALLMQAAQDSEERETVKNRLSPEFYNGGFSWDSVMAKVRPGEGVRFPGSNYIHTVSGQDRGYDSEHMFLPKGTRVYTNREMQDAEPHQSGGFVGTPATVERMVVPESVELIMDKEDIVEMVFTHRKFGKAVVKNVRLAAKSGKL